MTKNKKKNFHIYFWCCDFYSNTGEGKLAILFLDYLLKIIKKKTIKIETFNKDFYIKKKIQKEIYLESKKINFNPFRNYFLPFLGIFMLWINYFKSKKIFYINYLPLWNIFIFLLAPPKTNFGPITGSIYLGKVNNLSTFIRKYIFFILFNISYLLLLIRKTNLIFATNNLYSLNKNISHNKNLFNFQILYLHNKKITKIKKNIDFLIYYRKHGSKNYNYLKKIISHNIFKKNYCIGNKFSFKSVNNLGVIDYLRAQDLLARARFTFVTSENFQSFHCMDSVLNSLNIFFDKNYIRQDKNLLLNYVKFKKVYLSNSSLKKFVYYKTEDINKKKLNLLHNHSINFLKNYLY